MKSNFFTYLYSTFFREIEKQILHTRNRYPREIFANAIFHDTPKTEGNIGFVWNPASPNSWWGVFGTVQVTDHWLIRRWIWSNIIISAAKKYTNKINSLFISEKFREIAQHLPKYQLPITVLLFYWRIHSCAAFRSWFLLYDLLTENFDLIINMLLNRK